MGPERIEQIKVVNWVKQCTDMLIVYIANEGKRTVIGGAIMKKMGLCPGACDLFLPRASRGYHGLWLEMKARSGKLTPKQIQFMCDIIDEGYYAVAVWNAEAAIEIIKTFYDSTASDSQLRSLPVR